MTADSPPPLRWWGWGERTTEIPSGLISLLDEELGVRDAEVFRPPAFEEVRMPEATLPARVRRSLQEVVGGFHLRDDREERIRHAAGRSYLDLLRLRSGVLDEAPDAVLHPGNAEETLAALRLCAEESCAVVPFGGGTSVVGGVAPLHRSFGSLVSLDVDRLDAIREIDRVSLTATLDAGMRGPRIEAELHARGLTLGHFPQSFEFATAGGFAATSSAGQASGGYGRFDEMVRGLRLQTPTGELRVDALPPNAMGPSVVQLILGSEGAFGVISDVTVRVQRRPEMRHYGAWSLPDFASGLRALREVSQNHQTPDVARLADAEETRVSLAMARGRLAEAGRRYLRVRGHMHPCLAIFGWEGDGASVGRRARAVAPHLRAAGAVALGRAPALAWRRDRFSGPYLRDALLDRRVLVETLETATPWSRVERVREDVVAALRTALTQAGTAPLIGCHVSHIYPDGASLYFTVLARQQDGAEAEQWLHAKQLATDAVLAAGGALSHHHGIGIDHAAWMDRAIGSPAVALLRASKRVLDPRGVMNPGKLVDTAGYPVSDSNRWSPP